MPKKYLCGVAFQYELGETNEIGIYDSVKELKESGQCWKNCGIVEILINEGNDPEFYYSHKWIVKQKMFGAARKDPKAKKESDR